MGRSPGSSSKSDSPPAEAHTFGAPTRTTVLVPGPKADVRSVLGRLFRFRVADPGGPRRGCVWLGEHRACRDGRARGSHEQQDVAGVESGPHLPSPFSGGEQLTDRGGHRRRRRRSSRSGRLRGAVLIIDAPGPERNATLHRARATAALSSFGAAHSLTVTRGVPRATWSCPRADGFGFGDSGRACRVAGCCGENVRSPLSPGLAAGTSSGSLHPGP